MTETAPARAGLSVCAEASLHPEIRAANSVTDVASRLTGGEAEYRSLVGRRVRLQRLWLRRSQGDIAAASSVSRNFVSATELGNQKIDAWRLNLIAHALDTTLAWLLDPESAGLIIPGPPSDGGARRPPA